MTKHDIILIFFIILLAVTGFFITSWPPEDIEENQTLTGEISVNGNILHLINLTNLTEKKTLEIPGPLGISTVEAKKDALRMNYSPCPDEHCMRTGWIDKPGQTIVCVPNRIIIKISARTNYVDTISK